jgi:DNA-binding beta-propeller fold protein YncE
MNRASQLSTIAGGCALLVMAATAFGVNASGKKDIGGGKITENPARLVRQGATDASGAASGPNTQEFDSPRPFDVSALVAKNDRAGRSGFLPMDQDPEGDHPYGVAFTPDGSTIAVVQATSDNVTFYDVATRSPIGTVAVGNLPTDIAITPDGAYAVTTNLLSTDVSIINIPNLREDYRVPVTGSQPYAVEITSDSATAVVGVINDIDDSTFSVIDIATGIETLSFLAPGQGVTGFVSTFETQRQTISFTAYELTNDDAQVILPDSSNDVIWFFDIATGNPDAQLVATATTESPRDLDLSDDGTLAVVRHSGADGPLTIVDVATMSILSEISVGASLKNDPCITPDNNYVIVSKSSSVIFVDLSTGAITSEIGGGGGGGFQITYDGQYAFYGSWCGNVLNIASQTLAKQLDDAESCAAPQASPVDYTVVALNNDDRDDIQFFNANGALSSLLETIDAGEPEEGDCTYDVAISADGTRAVAANMMSRNLAVIDMTTETVVDYIYVGDRFKTVAITPDGSYAVGCAMEDNNVQVVDLDAGAVVKTITIYTRPGLVEISPDGQYAYVANIATTDKVTKILLDGANSQVVGSALAGQMGSRISPPFTELSGIALSPDGSILAVCDSFNDFLLLFDTVTMTDVAAVPMGDFPLRVAFSGDGSRAFVTCYGSHETFVVEVDGVNSTLLGWVETFPYPLTVNADMTGDYAYVGTRYNGEGTQDAIHVIDANTLSVVKVIDTGDFVGSARDSIFSYDDNILYLATNVNGDALVRIDAAGPLSEIIDTTPLTGWPLSMAYCPATKTVLVAEPIEEGVDIFNFGAAPCPWDFDESLSVGIGDLNALLSNWGAPCPGAGCSFDYDESGSVGLGDLNAMLSNWGPCP